MQTEITNVKCTAIVDQEFTLLSTKQVVCRNTQDARFNFEVTENSDVEDAQEEITEFGIVVNFGEDKEDTRFRLEQHSDAASGTVIVKIMNRGASENTQQTIITNKTRITEIAGKGIYMEIILVMLNDDVDSKMITVNIYSSNKR